MNFLLFFQLFYLYLYIEHKYVKNYFKNEK